MDSDSIPLIIVLGVLVLFSAYFSASETAFTSINRIKLKTMAQDGNKKANRVLKMSEDYNTLLTTLLIGNNIVNIAISTIATVLFIGLLKGDTTRASTLATIVVTVVVLIFGEITPKSIAKDMPEKFAMFSAPLLRLFTYIFYPLNIIFSGWKKLISLIVKPNEDDGEIEDELLTMVEEAETEGNMGAEEVELIKNAIEFNDIEVSDILQPRVAVEAVEVNDEWDEIEQKFRDTGYSRLPVYKETIDNMIGVINQKHFFMAKEKKLKKLIKPIEFVVPTMKISELLVKLQKEKSHMAAVADEYGGISGIVTLEDIIEELVGEIWDEHDEVIEEILEIGENEYRVQCSASLNDMFDEFDVNDDLDISTVGGWVNEELKHVPEVGETFEYKNLFVTVTKSDNKHALEINVKVNELEEDENE